MFKVSTIFRKTPCKTSLDGGEKEGANTRVNSFVKNLMGLYSGEVGRGSGAYTRGRGIYSISYYHVLAHQMYDEHDIIITIYIIYFQYIRPRFA